MFERNNEKVSDVNREAIDIAIGRLSQRKEKVFGLIQDPERGIEFWWRGGTRPVLKFWVSDGANLWTEKDFPYNIIFEIGKDDRPFWYLVVDQELNPIIPVSNNIEAFTCIAIVIPTRDVTMKKQAPICFKARFNKFGSASMVVQSAEAGNMLLLEGEELERNYRMDKEAMVIGQDTGFVGNAQQEQGEIRSGTFDI